MARIAVVGSGYVGLATGACLARLGHSVTCADVDVDKVARLPGGELPVHEPDLDGIVASACAAGRLRFTDDPAAGVDGAEFVYLCLPTPRRADASADLSSVTTAARTIGPHLEPGAVVVTKSTVPVGSSHRVVEALGRADVAVVSNPEFLREGAAVADFLRPDRVVVGSTDRSAARRVAALHAPDGVPVVLTDPVSAETTKYVSNAFLATRLSFCNGIAALCEAVGADVDDVLCGMGHDRRIGHDFLRPGPGWGGSCFPKETDALLAIAADHGFDFRLLRHAVEANREQFDRVVDKVTALAGGSVAGVRIAAWGLTFKADTDDLRGSPATEIVRRLVDAGATVCAYDPTVRRPPRGLDVEIADDPYAACEGARFLVVLTEWDELRDADLSTGRFTNLLHHAADPGFWFVRADVTRALPVDGPVDVVAHLASPASPVHYRRLPVETLAAGSVGTRRALDLALRHGARFLLASTSEVYGDPEVHLQPESYRGSVDPVGPRSMYDEANRFAEALTVAYHRRHGLDVRIARIFNTYGPRLRADDGRVVPTLIAQALRGELLSVCGDGSRTRSFAYVDDEVRLLLALLDVDHVGPVNLGSDQEVRLDDLAALVLDVTGSTAPLQYVPVPPDDPARRRPDLTLARSLFGTLPATPLREGLRRTSDWFASTLTL